MQHLVFTLHIASYIDVHGQCIRYHHGRKDDNINVRVLYENKSIQVCAKPKATQDIYRKTENNGEKHEKSRCKKKL